MRQYFLLVILFVLTIDSSWAQSNAYREGVQSRFRPGIGWFYKGLGISGESSDKMNKFDRLVVDITHPEWHGDIDPFKNTWYSVGVNIAFMFDIPFTSNNTTGLGVGLGFSHFNHQAKIGYSLDFDNKTTFIDPNQPAVWLGRQTMGFNYLEVPLELRFRVPYGEKSKEHVKFIVGGKFGYRLQSYLRNVNKTDGSKHAFKTIHLPDSNPLRYGVHARIGIRNWAIYGAYYFSPLFKSDNSVQLYPFEFGLSIALF